MVSGPLGGGGGAGGASLQSMVRKPEVIASAKANENESPMSDLIVVTQNEFVFGKERSG